jgi:beta-phosphoglucomutase family hydrolase
MDRFHQIVRRTSASAGRNPGRVRGDLRVITGTRAGLRTERVATITLTGMDWGRYEAVLFDLDGVVTPTADVHMRAWSAMFNDFLAAHPGPDGPAAPYTDDDYFAFVDGRPRYDGVRAFLASRGITLPEGHPDDGPDAETVAGLGNRKNAAFAEVLRTDGVQAYPGSVRLLDTLRDRGVPMAIVSSSRNAPAVLEAAGVTHYFRTVMHGGVAAERGLAGKPAPDTFLTAAEDLGATAATSVVLEDAVSGVRAGAAGDFALVIGVDRGVGPDALTAAGADLVVADLAELL